MFRCSNFKNFHGINPLFLTFGKAKPKRRVENRQTSGPVADCKKQTPAMADQDQHESRWWQLEKEFLTLNDDFFIFYLAFSCFLSVVIGVIKYAIVPKLQLTSLSLVIQTGSVTVIVATILYCRHSFEVTKRCDHFQIIQSSPLQLSFFKRNIIWFVVTTCLLTCSLNDLVVVREFSVV